MNPKLMLAIMIIISTLFQNVQDVPALGDEWKGEILKNTPLFIPSGMTKAGKLLLKNGQEFSIGINDNNRIVYIDTKSTSFVRKGISVGKKLSEFTKIEDVKIHKGWGGGYVKIDEDWYAAFSSKDLTDSSKVLFLFKYDMPTTTAKPKRIY